MSQTEKHDFAKAEKRIPTEDLILLLLPADSPSPILPYDPAVLPFFDMYLAFAELSPDRHRARLLSVRDFPGEEQELYERRDEVLANTARLLPPSADSIEQCLDRLLTDSEEEHPGSLFTDSSREPLNISVITNQSTHYGATAVLYPNFLKSLFPEEKEEIFLIPSSIHEFLAVSSGNHVSPDYLLEVLKDVNRNVVRPEDFLSNTLYRYDLRSQSILPYEVPVKEDRE